MTAQKKPSMPVVELSPYTHLKLLQFAREDDRSVGDILGELVDRYERERYWTRVHRDYARLRADPDAWRSYVAEVEAWDVVAGDGLAGADPYYSEEEVREILAEASGR